MLEIRIRHYRKGTKIFSIRIIGLIEKSMYSIAEIMGGKSHKLFDDQVKVFIEFGKRTGTVKSDIGVWLSMFSRHSQKQDVWDIKHDDIAEFLDYVRSKYYGEHHSLEAERSVRNLLKFYRARGKNSKSFFKSGRPKMPKLPEDESSGNAGSYPQEPT